MPGDEINQKITVKNGSNKMVKIFLRAVANENTVMQGFLQQLSMTVKQGDKILFDALPNIHMNGRLLFNKWDGKPVPYTIFMLIVGARSARPK